MSNREEDHDYLAMQAVDAARNALPATVTRGDLQQAQAWGTIALAEAMLAVYGVVVRIYHELEKGD